MRRKALLVSLAAAVAGYAVGFLAYSRVGAQLDRAVARILSDA